MIVFEYSGSSLYMLTDLVLVLDYPCDALCFSSFILLSPEPSDRPVYKQTYLFSSGRDDILKWCFSPFVWPLAEP